MWWPASNILSVEELPSFTPSFNGGGSALVIYGNHSELPTGSGLDTGIYWSNANIAVNQFNSIGGNKYHNNLQPYMAVYVWHRTA